VGIEMKVALYARVSTLDKGQNPETQLMPLREYCQRMGWQYEEFVDYASGVDGKREQFNEMLARIKRREFDLLMVWKLDRLARSLSQLISVVYGELHPRNIQFISMTEGIDTTTPSGMLIFHILGAIAQFEHDLIAERVRAGMARAKAQGKRIGRKQVKVDTEALKEAYDRLGSYRAVAREFGLNPGLVWSRLQEKETNDEK